MSDGFVVRGAEERDRIDVTVDRDKVYVTIHLGVDISTSIELDSRGIAALQAALSLVDYYHGDDLGSLPVTRFEPPVRPLRTEREIHAKVQQDVDRMMQNLAGYTRPVVFMTGLDPDEPISPKVQAELERRRRERGHAWDYLR